MEDIKKKAIEIRREVLKMAVSANGGHIAPAYSMADILAVLFWGGVMNYDPSNPKDPDRDTFILSKGHAVLGLYAALAMSGYFDAEEMMTFCKPGSRLGSLAKMDSVPGVEATTGSLGHGFSYAVGIALANKLDGRKAHTFVMLGDGECEEGSVWEAAMSAAHHKLNKLTVIVDNNGLQGINTVEKIMSLTDIASKFASFGFDTVEINGHDYDEIKMALDRKTSEKPVAVIAHTVKGKGISFMEGIPVWHYRVPNSDELKVAAKELGMSMSEFGVLKEEGFRNVI